jgi:cellulose synthase/poly-beta-1,6-N-acetylglucosamine synthase-like glycosyltransferase
VTATLILAGSSAICLLLYCYPYLFYPLALRLLSKRPIRSAPTEHSVSILFCAFNEIDCLPHKIENLRQLKQSQPNLQILAYDDASTDGTFELLSSVPDLITTIRGPGRTGKAAGMKQLVQQARGDILVLSDADVEFQPDAIDRLLPYYGDPEVGGVCCSVRMVCVESSATSHTGSLYWSWDDRIQQLESATGSVMGASGAMFSVRRELYPEFPDTVQDDFTVSMSVIFAGKRLVKAPDVVAFTKSVSKSHDELRRKVRIGSRAYHTHCFLRPQLGRMSPRDRFKYFSHKFLRWFGGLFVLLGALLGLAAVASLSLTAAGLLLVAAMLVAGLSIRLDQGHFGKAGQIGLATLATQFGILQGMRGRTVATWARANSP